MANLSYNTERFTEVNKWDENYSYKGILIAGKLNQKNGQDYKLIDAIDIDWNGGWLSTLNSYINTTEDLLIAIDNINRNSSIDDIMANVEKFKDTIDSIINSYVTHQQLPNILSSYQRVLTPGSYISIDQDTDTISVVGVVEHSQLEEILTSYATNYDLNRIEQDMYSNFYMKFETEEVAAKAAEDAIKKVIDNADEAFDTLKEVADWILAQSRYEPVAYEDMILDGSVDYYIYNQETNEYSKVTLEYIQEHPDEQYYRLCDTTTDVADLFNSIAMLQQTVGSKTDLGDGNFAYTGMQLQIDDLRTDHRILSDNVESIANEIVEISLEANAATKTANQAYSYALTAYDLASYSLSITVEGINHAEEAYVIACKAREDVGVSSIAGYYYEITPELKEQIANGELVIDTTYVINNYTGEYIESGFNPDSDETFYGYFTPVLATGLTGRVEDVETRADEIEQNVENVRELADTALYRLSVNNAESEFVTLSLSPSSWVGTNERTIAIATENAIFDPITGEILNNGIPTISTVRDIYTYASSWQILPSPSSVNDDVVTDDSAEQQD